MLQHDKQFSVWIFFLFKFADFFDLVKRDCI